MKFFGVRNRPAVTSAASGENNAGLEAAGNGNVVNVNGKDWKSNDLNISSSRSSNPEQKLVESMILVGKKIREYEDILYHESVLKNEDVDMLKLEAFVRRYMQEIKVTDAIRSNSTKGSGEAGSVREAYHRYAIGLQKYIREPNLNLCFKINPPETELTKSKDEPRNPVESDHLNQDQTDGVIVEKIEENIPQLPAPTKEDSVGSFPGSSLQGECVCDGAHCTAVAEPEVTYHTTPVLVTTPLTSHSTQTEDQNTTPKIKSRRPARKQLNTTVAAGNVLVGEDGPAEGDDIVDAALLQKFAVLKAKIKKRPRISNIFPVVHSTPIPTKLIPRHQDRFGSGASYSHDQYSKVESGGLTPGDSEDSAPWANKSKSANESWYEFKERCCSRSSMNSVSPSPSKTFFRDSSPYNNGDNMQEEQQRSTLTVPHRNATRFSPIQPGRKKYYIPSDSSSDDEELSFEVDQFPCVSQNSVHHRQRHRSRRH